MPFEIITEHVLDKNMHKMFGHVKKYFSILHTLHTHIDSLFIDVYHNRLKRDWYYKGVYKTSIISLI